MPDIMQMGKNPNFLGSWDLYDLPTQKITVTIHKIADEEVINQGKKETVTVCHFREDVKPMILNLTNKKTLSKLYRTKDSDKLSGELIQIGYEKVKAFGKISDALRISNTVPTRQTPVKIVCEACGNEVTPAFGKTAKELAEYTKKGYGKAVCAECAKRLKEEREAT